MCGQADDRRRSGSDPGWGVGWGWWPRAGAQFRCESFKCLVHTKVEIPSNWLLGPGVLGTSLD